MNPYLMSLPTVTAALIVLYFSLRALRESRIADAVHRAEHEKKVAEFARQRANRTAEAASARAAVLRVTLDLRDSGAVIDVASVSQDTERMLAGLSEYEIAIGGRGLTLTEAKAEPGRVILTLTPKNATGATDRVARVAAALNAAFDSADRPAGESVPDLGRLPRDVAGARAVALAA